jgi:DNA-binding HxlR family transcriptional regulator
VTYSLTGLGQEVTAHLAGLLDWIDTHIPDVLEARAERAAVAT